MLVLTKTNLSCLNWISDLLVCGSQCNKNEDNQNQWLNEFTVFITGSENLILCLATELKRLELKTTLFLNSRNTLGQSPMKSQVTKSEHQKQQETEKMNKSYEAPANFKIFVDVNFSMYDQCPKFQWSWSLCIKVMWFAKYTPNGLRDFRGKIVNFSNAFLFNDFPAFCCDGCLHFINHLKVVVVHIILKIHPRTNIWEVQFRWMWCPLDDCTSCWSAVCLEITFYARLRCHLILRGLPVLLKPLLISIYPSALSHW